MSENSLKVSDEKKHLVTAKPLMQWVTFVLQDETYAINVMQVQEVVKYTKISLVPGTKDYICGIINLRGEIITVIDTRTRVGLPGAKDQTQSRIIVAEAQKQVIGIMVDSVSDVVELKQEDIDSSAVFANKDKLDFIEAVCEYNNKKIILMDLDKLLSEAEWEEMSRL